MIKLIIGCVVAYCVFFYILHRREEKIWGLRPEQDKRKDFCPGRSK
jgi:hypothetical protein